MKIRIKTAIVLACMIFAAAAQPQSTKPPTGSSKTETAIFSGGCFWCMQPPFDALKNQGVIATVVGYTGGTKDHPTYREVSAGGTGHRESVEVTFDPKKIGYEKLLEVYWHNIDPFDSKGEFCDDGEQYTSAVFYTTPDQKRIFEKTESKFLAQAKVKGSIQTKLLPAKRFWPAESYHQEYYRKNPIRYHFYRSACGRDRRLKAVWGRLVKSE